MKPVIQEEISGCAIASVAAIAGVTYSQAKRAASRLGIHAEDSALWSDTGPIRRLLGHYRIRTARGETPFTTWESLPDCALLAIKWHLEKGRPCWHWVVFVREADREQVLDSKSSLKTHVRTDFGRMKPKWYIQVHI